jgi:hypothetical protein
MPYWQQINPLMDCVQRLAYTLSQGHHVCDVAILYPTEPVVADFDGKKSVTVAFETGNLIYDKGVDFDFIDFESMYRAVAQNGELQVSGEKYKVLIVPSMKAIRYSTLLKLEAFKKAGGIIVNVGALPEATEKSSTNDDAFSKLVTSIFTVTPKVVLCKDQTEVFAAIAPLYLPNFKVLSELKTRPYVMHRQVGKREIFALYNIPQDAKCFFNAKGSVERWNPWNGKITSLSQFATPTKDGTEITLPSTSKEIQLIVFTPENTVPKETIKEAAVSISNRSKTLDNTWKFELKPSLDNQWGDFQLPASKEMMGAQVRQMHLKEIKKNKAGQLINDGNQRDVSCEYGTQFLKLGPLASLPDEEMLKTTPQNTVDSILVGDKKHCWEEYSFSWQHGVEGDYGHQGYHGLKGQMYDNFIRLGAMADVKMSMKRVPEKQGHFYMLYTTVQAPANGQYELLTGDEKPAYLFINSIKTDSTSKRVQLNKGPNTVMAVYDKACETYLVFRKPNVARAIKRQVSMSWKDDKGVLPFDCSPVTHVLSGLFTFNSAPGLKSFTFSAYGNVIASIDSVKARLTVIRKDPDGLTAYRVNLKEIKSKSARVDLYIIYQPGYTGGAAIPQYIKQQCGKGLITLGDWSLVDGLKAYSGGAWYRKTINIAAGDVKKHIGINLGDLVSSAELFINGKSAGIKLSPPWQFDLTGKVKPGANKIEVLIYNTLSNNYTTIPTRYRGSIRSGLIGPVTLDIGL